MSLQYEVSHGLAARKGCGDYGGFWVCFAMVEAERSPALIYLYPVFNPIETPFFWQSPTKHDTMRLLFTHHP
jgi:hypothetical protein